MWCASEFNVRTSFYVRHSISIFYTILYWIEPYFNWTTLYITQASLLNMHPLQDIKFFDNIWRIEKLAHSIIIFGCSFHPTTKTLWYTRCHKRTSHNFVYHLINTLICKTIKRGSPGTGTLSAQNDFISHHNHSVCNGIDNYSHCVSFLNDMKMQQNFAHVFFLTFYYWYILGIIIYSRMLL